MKKRIVISLFAALLCTSVFATGCGSNEEQSGTVIEVVSQDQQTASSEASSVASSEASSSTEVSSSAEISSSEEVSSATEKIVTEKVDSYNNGIVVAKQNGHYRALELFGGGTGETFAKAMNSLKSKVGSNVNVYAMPCPQSSEFYTPDEYAAYTTSQDKCFQNVASQLNDVICINISAPLRNHVNEDIYLRTDHHWSPLGAYYASEIFSKVADVPFIDLESGYTKHVTEGFVGTLYAESSSGALMNDPDTFVYYTPKKNNSAKYYDQSWNFQFEEQLVYDNVADNDLHSNEYYRFLGGDSYAALIETDVKNGRSLLIVKDSYGNAEVPFYTGSFEKIYVTDMRYFEKNLAQFVQEQKITDVLVTCSVFSVFGENASSLSAKIG